MSRPSLLRLSYNYRRIWIRTTPNGFYVEFNGSMYRTPGGGGKFFRNFRLAMCRWDPRTLT